MTFFCAFPDPVNIYEEFSNLSELTPEIVSLYDLGPFTGAPQPIAFGGGKTLWCCIAADSSYAFDVLGTDNINILTWFTDTGGGTGPPTTSWAAPVFGVVSTVWTTLATTSPDFPGSLLGIGAVPSVLSNENTYPTEPIVVVLSQFVAVDGNAGEGNAYALAVSIDPSTGVASAIGTPVSWGYTGIFSVDFEEVGEEGGYQQVLGLRDGLVLFSNSGSDTIRGFSVDPSTGMGTEVISEFNPSDNGGEWFLFRVDDNRFVMGADGFAEGFVVVNVADDFTITYGPIYNVNDNTRPAWYDARAYLAWQRSGNASVFDVWATAVSYSNDTTNSDGDWFAYQVIGMTVVQINHIQFANSCYATVASLSAARQAYPVRVDDFSVMVPDSALFPSLLSPPGLRQGDFSSKVADAYFVPIGSTTGVGTWSITPDNVMWAFTTDEGTETPPTIMYATAVAPGTTVRECCSTPEPPTPPVVGATGWSVGEGP